LLAAKLGESDVGDLVVLIRCDCGAHLSPDFAFRSSLEAPRPSRCSLPAMRGMVLAAGLGTRLRPLTWDVSKPMVPVANRPIMEHVLRTLARNEVDEIIANLHWYGDSIRN